MAMVHVLKKYPRQKNRAVLVDEAEIAGLKWKEAGPGVKAMGYKHVGHVEGERGPRYFVKSIPGAPEVKVKAKAKGKKK